MRQNATPFYERGQLTGSASQAKSATLSGTNAPRIMLNDIYIYPESGNHATLVNIGEEVEVLSERRNTQELERRKDAIVHRQLSWQDQMGEATRSFDPSNESW